MIVFFLKDYLRLDSPLLMAAVLAVLVAWLFARPAARGPRRALLAVVLGYWLVSSPIGAGLLAVGLTHGMAPLATRDAARGADAVVVLGGGASTFRQDGAVVGLLMPTSVLRALEGARVAKLIDARLVIASGGSPHDYQLKPESSMIRDALVEAGVAPDRVLEESESKTTREQAQILRRMLAAHGVTRFVLVTSPLHMRRSLAVFRAEGMDPVPSASLLASDNAVPPPWFLPNVSSLNLSSLSVYEYAAGIYYWMNGWTRPAATGT